MNSTDSLITNARSAFDNIVAGARAQPLALICALLIWALTVTGFFNSADALIYDYYSKWTTKLGSEVQDIIIVEYNPTDWNIKNDDWINAITLLEEMNAKEIVFTHLPGDLKSDFFQKAKTYNNIVFGRKLITDPKNPDEYSVEPFPEEIDNVNIKYGVIGIPASSHGVYRYQNRSYEVKGEKMDALETVIATKYLDKAPNVSGKYLINFSGGVERLPKITLQKLLKKEGIKELFSNKIVMIGYTNAATDVGLVTPGIDPNYPLSLVEFQSFAVDTLINHKAVSETGAVTNLIIFVAIALLSFILYFQVETTTVAFITIGLVFAYAVISFISLKLLLLWPPLVEAMILQVILFGAFYSRKSIIENLTVTKMIVELTERINRKVSPPGFHLTPEYWKHVINMVDQVLSLNKIIFLERVKNDHRVREVVGLRCSLTDIAENRRDYERTPYSTALQERKPIVIQKYFKNVIASETQYLLPLLFSGEVMGFWAFTVQEASKEAIPDFDKTLNTFGEQIANLLYQRQMVKVQEAREKTAWFKYWLFEQSTIYSQLQKSIMSFNRQLNIYENIFDGLNEASILYDLFGRVLKINKLMSELMQEEGLSPFSFNAQALIERLTGLETDYVKKCMKHVILDQRRLVFPAGLKGKKDRAYILSIRDLRYQPDRLTPGEEAYPFQSIGILLELIDVTKMNEFYKIKEQVIDRVKIQYSNDLQSILLGISLIMNKNLEETKRQRAADISGKKIVDSVGLVTDAQKLLDVDLQFGFVKCYPIDAKSPINFAIDTVTSELYSKNIKIKKDVPDLVNLVYASQNELVNMIRAILKFLIQDAVEDSEIQVAIEESRTHVIYTFSNKGFGMPNERFQFYLSTKGEVSITEFGEIRDLIPIIKEWGGELKAESAVGIGTSFVLKLKGFM